MRYTADKNRYKEMMYNRCGNSGLLLPAVSLGLWHNFGHVDHYDTAREVLFTAFDHGITHFDLANNYGPPPGSAEENFGKILRNDLSAYRDEMIISTKAGYLMWDGPYGEWGSRKYLLASLNQSLKRMGLEYVDIFYSHRFDPDTPIEETMGALATAVHQGKALYVGISNYDAETTRKAAEILESLGTPCLIHQPKYSMLERWVEKGLLDVLEEKGIGCITYSPLAQGLLTDKYLNGIPENSRAAKPHGFLRKSAITDDLIRMLRKLNNMAKDRGQSLAQMALSWVLKDPRITSVLVGARYKEQLLDSLQCLEKTGFSTDELEVIDSYLAG
ncbi:MAG: L-glyceraldehyde 3-phosphate reductase [Chlorobi bacterium]|nr:L-glyceraldehyde 3-phosphate reductase [Chlorobiota bacterium]